MIDLTPLDVRKKRGDFGKGLRGYDPQEVDGFLELVAERMEVLVKENLVFREQVERLEEKVATQEGREQAVQDALVTAQELRQDMKKQASREAKVLEREARAHIEGMIGESEKLLIENSAALKELGRHRDRFLKAFRTFLEREVDTIEVELGRNPLEGVTLDLEFAERPWSIGEAEEGDADTDKASASENAETAEVAEPAADTDTAEDTEAAETVKAAEAAEVEAADDDAVATGSAAPKEEVAATEADGERPPEEQDGGDSLWLSSIMMDRKEEGAE
jgi:cell division initiation protein